jgi:hypothetical protein
LTAVVQTDKPNKEKSLNYIQTYRSEWIRR